MLTILKKFNIKIRNIFKGNYRPINKNEQSLLKKVEALDKLVNNSSNSIEILKRENSIQKTRLLNIEAMLKNIHFNIIADRSFCPLCDSELPTFIPGGVNNARENALCPKCGSLERNRAAYLFLKEETNIFSKNIKMLHFAPERLLSEIFRKKENIDYLPVDINPNMPGVKEKMDIQDIKYPDNTFDLIYCSHVLEHVPNDKKALEELYRVLKPNGKAIIQVPLNRNFKETFEDESFNTPELRLKHYGQSDHVRFYGLDFQKKLENAGFKASNEYVGSMDRKSQKKYGFENDNLFYCTK